MSRVAFHVSRYRIHDMRAFLSTAAALLLALASAAGPADRVVSLPGAPTLRSAHYAGYLASTGAKQVYYHFIESESAPASDPIVRCCCSASPRALAWHANGDVATADALVRCMRCIGDIARRWQCHGCGSVIAGDFG